MEFVDMHQDLIISENPRKVLSTDDQKIIALNEIYSKAANPHNPERLAYRAKLETAMFGRIMNEIQSYDYIDNEKYKQIEKLLEIMKETFGFESETPEGEEGQP